MGAGATIGPMLRSGRQRRQERNHDIRADACSKSHRARHQHEDRRSECWNAGNSPLLTVGTPQPNAVWVAAAVDRCESGKAERSPTWPFDELYDAVHRE